MIQAKEEWDVMTLDIPSIFIQTTMLIDVEWTIIKKRSVLVDILVEIASKVHKDFVICDRKKNNILYVNILKPLCGMMKVGILYYKKFTKDITEIKYALNPYEPCVVNKIVNN